ncbi:MAG: cyclase family protein [Alphaproteobacteria bacterium]|nr:cyclase family protein [Alphaproteobacteria bacterium]
MCAPGCMQVVHDRLSRRGFFSVAAAAAATATVASSLPVAPANAAVNGFSKVVDLTHELSAEFPTFSGDPGIALQKVYAFEKEGFNLNRWNLNEHTGTHMDAPIHFSADQADAAGIPADKLVLPLVVVDIAARAETDVNAQLTPDDLKAWEAKHGTIPAGSCVALRSGWDKHVGSDKFRGAKDSSLHFPGFHVEAADMMIERGAAGMASDTLSLDYGQSKKFSTHYKWLPSGRWGLECVANLGDVPEAGATIVVGGPKIKGATGGPTRIFALV